MRLSPAKVIAGGFLAIILLGALLLMLPISSAGRESTSFLNALFTSTSAVCVTGLIVVDTGVYWSGFGQLVIILLIQVGGLGFMTLATLLAILTGKRIGLKDRILAQEALGKFEVQGVVSFIIKIIKTSVLIEGLGVLLLLFCFVPRFGWGKGLWYSIFHSISAFCNAGFDVLGDGRSLAVFRGDLLVNFAITTLIICGGLGFTVMYDLAANRKRLRRISLHSKLVVSMTLLLLFFGALLFFVLEFRNAATIGEAGLYEKILASWFQSVTTRTAGFESIPQGALTESSRFLTILLMFVGGSPGSTAGGIKTTTLAVALLSMLAYVRKSDVHAFGRRIGYEVINKAMATVLIGFVLVLFSALVLSIENPQIQFLNILYEAVSAFGTAGLSTGITGALTGLSKVLLIILMFAGRVGALTVVLAIAGKERKRRIHYPEGRVML